MLKESIVIWLWTTGLYWIFTIELDWKQLKRNLILESHSTDVAEDEKMRSSAKRCYGNPFTGSLPPRMRFKSNKFNLLVIFLQHKAMCWRVKRVLILRKFFNGTCPVGNILCLQIFYVKNEGTLMKNIKNQHVINKPYLDLPSSSPRPLFKRHYASSLRTFIPSSVILCCIRQIVKE